MLLSMTKRRAKRTSGSRTGRLHVSMPLVELARLRTVAAGLPFDGNLSLVVRSALQHYIDNPPGAKVLPGPGHRDLIRPEGR